MNYSYSLRDNCILRKRGGHTTTAIGFDLTFRFERVLCWAARRVVTRIMMHYFMHRLRYYSH